MTCPSGRPVSRATLPCLGAYAPYPPVPQGRVLEAEGFPIADVSDHLADPSAVVWFDLCEPHG
jgi:hypothetical protein